MTFWYAVRERGGGKWLLDVAPDYSYGTFVSDRAFARLWPLEGYREVRDVVLMLPVAVDMLAISDAP